MGILGAHVDVALGCTGGDAGDCHALDQGEGVTFHQHAVGKGPGVAFVGVADYVFLVGCGIEHGLPLDARGKGSAAASAQTRIKHFLDSRGRPHRNGFLEPAVAAVAAVIVQRQRIDNADTGESQPLLPFQEGYVFGHAEAEHMAAAFQESCIEQAAYVAGGYRAIGGPARWCCNLDHRFQPEQAAGSVAHHADAASAACGLGDDGCGNGIGTQRQGAGVAGHENSDGHEASRRFETKLSKRSADTRPCRSPSIITAGAQAQLPRQ